MTPAKTTTHKKVERKPAKPKAAAAVAVAAKPTPKVDPAEGRYYQAVGGRKTAAAVVRIWPGKSGITINGKDLKTYFKDLKNQLKVMAPLNVTDIKNDVGVTVQVKGSGINAQADAVRHGIALALTFMKSEFKKPLRRDGFLTRDARAVERKKYGLKKARRAPQWAKR